MILLYLFLGLYAIPLVINAALNRAYHIMKEHMGERPATTRDRQECVTLFYLGIIGTAVLLGMTLEKFFHLCVHYKNTGSTKFSWVASGINRIHRFHDWMVNL